MLNPSLSAILFHTEGFFGRSIIPSLAGVGLSFKASVLNWGVCRFPFAVPFSEFMWAVVHKVSER